MWHDKLYVFLFSSEELENHKHLKLVASHLSSVFAHTLYHYCLFIQRQYASILTLFASYIRMYIYIYMYIYCIMYITRWCPLVHFFDTPIQNSPYGHGLWPQPRETSQLIGSENKSTCYYMIVTLTFNRLIL